MARPPAYKLYSGTLATTHVSNDLQALIKVGKQLGKIFKRKYSVQDAYGKVVWESDA